jgi:dihydrofolate reductase
MKVTLVAALSENGVIGRDGDLPWRLPDDLRHFMRLTRGHCVIMGRRTFESMEGPLPERTNIVITSDPRYRGTGATQSADLVVVASLEAALDTARARGEKEAFVAGGSRVYAEALPRADRLVLTRVHARVDGDTHFPAWRAEDFERVRATPHPADARHAYPFTFEEYERRG